MIIVRECLHYFPLMSEYCLVKHYTITRDKNKLYLPLQSMNSFPEFFTIFHGSNLSFPEGL